MCGYQTLVPDTRKYAQTWEQNGAYSHIRGDFNFGKAKVLNEMSRLTQQSSDDNRYILVAKLDNARNLLNVLKAVYFKEVRECCNRVDIDMPYIKPFESWEWLVCKFSSKFWISVEQIGNEKIWHYQPGNKVFLECINIKTKKYQVMVKTISSQIFLFFYPRPVSLGH